MAVDINQKKGHDILIVYLKDKMKYLDYKIKHNTEIIRDKNIPNDIRDRAVQENHQNKAELNLILSSFTIIKRYNSFRDIVTAFNKKAMEAVVSEGYVINFGIPRLGCIYATIKERFKFPIDWGKTNKRKALLLDQGYTEKDLKTKDNPEGTVEYIVRHTSNYYAKIIWYTALNNSELAEYFNNREKYYFIPDKNFSAVATANASNEEDKYLSLYAKN